MHVDIISYGECKIVGADGIGGGLAEMAVQYWPGDARNSSWPAKNMQLSTWRSKISFNWYMSSHYANKGNSAVGLTT